MDFAFVFDKDFIAFATIELILISFFLVIQFSSKFNSRFLAGTSMDRRIFDRRLLDRRMEERRNDFRMNNDRRNTERRTAQRRSFS
jgi:hypothetical protein